jgi:UrcA family protein
MSNWAERRRVYAGAMTRALLAASLFALLAASPALAAGEPARIAVPIGDLDLHSAAGQAELKIRIVNAASTLCRPAWMRSNPDSDPSIRLRQMIYRACLGRATDRALASIDARSGAAAHN